MPRYLFLVSHIIWWLGKRVSDEWVPKIWLCSSGYYGKMCVKCIIFHCLGDNVLSVQYCLINLCEARHQLFAQIQITQWILLSSLLYHLISHYYLIISPKKRWKSIQLNSSSFFYHDLILWKWACTFTSTFSLTVLFS